MAITAIALAYPLLDGWLARRRAARPTKVVTHA
jgi:hypothetical protein